MIETLLNYLHGNVFFTQKNNTLPHVVKIKILHVHVVTSW